MNAPAPPSDLDAERATLGACLLERDAIIAIAPFLSPDHFDLERHARIYAAILACYERREPPDVGTVAAELRRRGDLERIGGLSMLGELATAVPTAVHIVYYARTVERTAMGRALIAAGGQIAALGFDDTRPLDERLEDAAQLVYRLSAQRQVGQGFVPLATVASEYWEAIAGGEASEDGLLGLATGFADLDQITQGMKAGELIILAARPGVGKTALAMTIARQVAERGKRVGVFSLEMDRDLLFQRLLSSDLGVPTTRVQQLVRRNDERVMDAFGRLSNLPIHVDHTPSLNVYAIRDRARRLAADEPVALWIVDYLQLAQGASERDDDVRRITAISQGLAAMAREFRTPVLALSQLSRAVEGRSDHVPMLSDLRGSGSIEQDASQVWFIYRPELYDDETDQPGVAEIHVAKHRNGETGMAPLRFDRATTRFHTLERYRAPEGY